MSALEASTIAGAEVPENQHQQFILLQVSVKLVRHTAAMAHWIAINHGAPTIAVRNQARRLPDRVRLPTWRRQSSPFRAHLVLTSALDLRCGSSIASMPQFTYNTATDDENRSNNIKKVVSYSNNISQVCTCYMYSFKHCFTRPSLLLLLPCSFFYPVNVGFFDLFWSINHLPSLLQCSPYNMSPAAATFSPPIGTMVVAPAILLSVSILFVALRIYVRMSITKSLWWDDAALVLSQVRMINQSLETGSFILTSKRCSSPVSVHVCGQW